VGEGENMRSMGHIDDLRCLYISLVEEAVRTLDIGEFREGCWTKRYLYLL
jgi:hypothetical protein